MYKYQLICVLRTEENEEWVDEGPGDMEGDLLLHGILVFQVEVTTSPGLLEKNHLPQEEQFRRQECERLQQLRVEQSLVCHRG